MAVPLPLPETRSLTMDSLDHSSIWTKPSTDGYTLRGLLDFPKRLISPPPANLPMLATVGSLTLRPAYDVRIEDMLDAKYLPPLGLRDFEEWLLFTEHSAENLYFIQWLRDYRKHYDAKTWTDTQLWFSFLRAKGSFFSPDGSLELNLPHAIVRDIHQFKFSSASNSNPSTSPPSPLYNANFTATATEPVQRASPISSAPSPVVFAEAEKHILNLLSASLAKFAGDVTSNAGVLRRFYCGSVGLASTGAGLIPVLLSIVRGYSRFYRLMAFPFFWLGGIIMLCAYAKICLVIYFWGDFRQLRGYELDMPTIAPATPIEKSSSAHSYPPTPHSPSSGTSEPSEYGDDDTKGGQTLVFPTFNGDLEGGRGTVIVNLPQRSPSSAVSGADVVASTPASKPRMAPPVPALLPRSPASAWGFDWDAPPLSVKSDDSVAEKRHSSPTSLLFASSNSFSSSSPSLSQMGAKLRPIFSPLTRVINPLVVRAMAEVVRRSTFWGALFGLLATAICFVVPFKGHGWNYGW